MLYRTLHPFFFHFHSFPSSISSSMSNTTSIHPSSSPLSTRAKTEMECVEAALKASLRREMGLKLSPQVCGDEQGCFNAQNVMACDDFFVDELLDFSNEDEFVEEEPEEEDEKGYASVSLSASSEQHPMDRENSNQSSGFSTIDEFGSVLSSPLSVPADDLADLEWLSHLVEDSFLEYSAPFPAAISTEKPQMQTEKRPEAEVVLFVEPCFKTPVPVKARSKRTRTGSRVWSLGSPSLAESSSCSSTSSSSLSSPPCASLVYSKSLPNFDPSQLVFPLEKPQAKKPKKKPAVDGLVGGGSQTPRRCTHCGVQKTPQWRTGPLGAKTLCNACGVRYKSGRLFPEYRPACSPTFSSELHSNHHRKVLEMRLKKEMPVIPDSGLTPPIEPLS